MLTKYDTIVVGAGLAGLFTANQLIETQKVLLVSHGIGAILLASGAIDVLGFQPAGSKTAVQNPLTALPNFLNEHPTHPYNLVGRQTIELAIERFLALTGDSDLQYKGRPDYNWWLPSAVGAVHPAVLAPQSLLAGDLHQPDRMLIVGFNELRDFYPSLTADNLRAQQLVNDAGAINLDAPPPIAGQPNTTPIELARAFERPDFRRAVVAMLKPQIKHYDRVGFPAVLGLEQHREVLTDLAEALGRPVFEISTLPPSVPGRRLFEHLKRTFISKGGRFVVGIKVLNGAIEDGRVTGLTVETANRHRTLRANNFVLATGGVYGGGLHTELNGQVEEPVFGLPVRCEDDRHKWFAADFLNPNGHPVHNFGVMTNNALQPVDATGALQAENLYVAGATLAGVNWTRGRTGDGVSLATATAIARRLSE